MGQKCRYTTNDNSNTGQIIQVHLSFIPNFMASISNDENLRQKNDKFYAEIMSQEIARTQDFASFTPELLGALSGPQTPGRKCAEQARRRERLRPSGLATFPF